jgi:hypothetical protein
MNASDYAAIGALVVSVATAIYTFYTYVLGRRALQVTTYQGATALALQMDQMFLDHPLLRPYFYDDEPVLAVEADPEMHHRVLAAAEFALDIVECIWDHRKSYEDDDRESWKDWIHDVFQGSPAIRDWYEKNIEWYPALRKLAEEAPNDTRGVPHIPL